MKEKTDNNEGMRIRSTVFLMYYDFHVFWHEQRERYKKQLNFGNEIGIKDKKRCLIK